MFCISFFRCPARRQSIQCQPRRSSTEYTSLRMVPDLRHEFSCTGPRSKATRGSREPLLKHGRSRHTQLAAGPQTEWKPTTIHGLKPARSIKSTSLVIPKVPQRLCRRAAHPALCVCLVPRRKLRMHAGRPSTQGIAPAPFPGYGCPRPGLLRVAQSVLGSTWVHGLVSGRAQNGKI